MTSSFTYITDTQSSLIYTRTNCSDIPGNSTQIIRTNRILFTLEIYRAGKSGAQNVTAWWW